MGEKKENLDFCLPEELNDIGVDNLRMGIIELAAEDAKEAYSGRGYAHYSASAAVCQIEFFYRSEWFKLFAGENIDGEQAIRSLRQQGMYKRWRRKMGCDRCPGKKCIHKPGTHYTILDKGAPTCPKQRGAHE